MNLFDRPNPPIFLTALKNLLLLDHIESNYNSTARKKENRLIGKLDTTSPASTAPAATGEST
ncbi:hypothetical protein EST38_g13619 [Candolleomyces aberdarensis]|uniref:Uncharacterized protein n=1 Tax=Candolleomyces aberdarensis TaxID=2316362 RepID=A0A4Q2D269_9AGAR|nr:hypothetical protein EST38_g13619 [Candolleomyces aberdarensis]